MAIPFAKGCGCGNDFILIDNREGSFPPHQDQAAKVLCDRRQGVGADGLILLGHSQSADFGAHIYNADGSVAEMCGNGMRCLGRFLQSLGVPDGRVSVETQAGILYLVLAKEAVSVEMGLIGTPQWDIAIKWKNRCYSIDSLNTGVPHAVISLASIDDFPLDHFGPFIRHHPRFAPKGTNVTICALDEGRIRVRTFERGVEAETAACGTGAVAAALVAAKRAGLKSPISAITSLGELLTVDFSEDLKRISLTGPATLPFHGEIIDTISPIE